MIKTVNLTKDFGKLRAVNQVNLSVKKGEIFGFLGLNGAGKTTTLKLVLGMLKPTLGHCYLKGEKIDPKANNIWGSVGYVMETADSYPDLTLKENLDLIRGLRGLKDRDCVNWVIKKLHLKNYALVKARHLSLGNNQRLAIAKAIVHRPDILILDEPTNGLDPTGIVEIRQLLKGLAEDLGTTIVISSHKLAEIAKIATNIAIIHQGKLIKSLTTKDLTTHLNSSLLVEGRNQKAIKSILLKAGYNLQSSAVPEYPDSCELLDERAIENPDTIATLLVNSGYPPTLLKVHREDLEAYFVRVINEWKDE